MSTVQYSLSYVDESAEWYMVCDTYTEVVAKTCDFLRPSDGAVIRVRKDEDANDMAFDELESFLNGLTDITSMLIQSIVDEEADEESAEKVKETITVKKINKDEKSESDHDDGDYQLEDDHYWREEEERDEYDEWRAGGGQHCGYCIDVCRCMSRGYESE